jgi:hypothetical protein
MVIRIVVMVRSLVGRLTEEDWSTVMLDVDGGETAGVRDDAAAGMHERDALGAVDGSGFLPFRDELGYRLGIGTGRRREFDDRVPEGGLVQGSGLAS